MVTSEERLKVLRMIQEGKITAEEGVKLMEMLDTDKTPPPVPSTPTSSGSPQGGRWLRIRVTELNSGKIKVNLRMPVNLVSAGIKMGARFSPDVQGLDIDHFRQIVESGETGQIVDIYDDEDGEHVEIFVE